MHNELTLRSEPAGVAAARRFIAGTLVDWGVPVDLELARLLTSELVTNAVIHGSGTVQVVVDWDGERVRVEVADRSRRAPRMPSGRAPTVSGLRIVDEGSSTWGFERRATGKVVYFELAPGPDGHERGSVLG